jgi:hypothetical protein
VSISMGKTSLLLAGLVLAATFANATSRNSIQIKVLDSETHSMSLAGGDIPKNCDQVNFDAYCNNSKTTVVTNTLLVQQGNQPSFRVTCTIESRWSRCVPLPKGETFEAKKGKHGITVYYIDDQGKARSQMYTLVDVGSQANLPATAVAVALPPASPVPAPEGHAAIPGVSPPPVVPNPPPAAAQEVPAEKIEKALEKSPEKAKVTCNFTSTPAGAEITLDDKYVGSTPSEIAVHTGDHLVVYSMPGFLPWKRELAVLSGSTLTVNAILQKQAQ